MKKDKKKLPFWLQIVSILLLGVIASVIAYSAANGLKTEDLQTHTVTFAYQDGTVIESKQVKHGKGVFPPELTDEGVFRGWSTGFNAVTADVEAHPVYYSISEDNLFYFDSVYVQEGKEFSLDVCIGGRVSVISAELTLQYDPDVLEFRQTDGSDGCTVTEEEKGTIKLSVQLDEAVKEETLLQQLTFFAKKKDAYSTQIDLSAAQVYTVANGQQITADYATINNRIYFLQEVG